MKPPYGFGYNEARDALVIHEPERRVVERISQLAADGCGTKAIQTKLYREDIPSPTGKEEWHRPVLKRMILSDTCKPHIYQETLALVGEGTACTRDLDPHREYGLRWWKPLLPEDAPDFRSRSKRGRHYHRKVTFASRD